jgi:hypothetical protein
MPPVLMHDVLAALAVAAAIMGAANAALTAYETSRARAPRMPDPLRQYGPGLEARRRQALAGLGRRWLLHPDNRVMRKWAR